MLEQLRGRLLDSPHREHCGLLLGHRERREIREAWFQPGTISAHRFVMSPEWMLRAFFRAREKDLGVAGFFHSHPKAALELSLSDWEGHPPGSLVMVLGLDESSELLWKVFRLQKNFPKAKRFTLVS